MASKKKAVRKTKATASKKSSSAKKKPKARKAPAKKAAKKKAPAKKKPAAKKAPAKKAKAPVAKKKVAAKKAAAKTSARKKAPTKRTATKKAKPEKDAVSGNGSKSGDGPPAKTRGRQNKHLTPRELKKFHQLLLNLRDSVVDEITFLAGDNLSNQVERTGEEGTDNFNREFALKLVSSEQDLIYEIDEAIQRIKNGTYGICEVSGSAIEKERLKVLPHARHSVKVQSELEKGRARYRPFGPSIDRG